MTPLPYLCLQIIEDVLVRLPVKSLIRCKCVCKAWQILISDPDFVKSHLNHRRRNRSRSKYRSWLCKINREWKKRSVEEFRVITKECEAMINGGEDDDGCGSSSEYDLYRPFDEIGKLFRIKVMILGSCDGLLCLGGPSSANRDDDEIVLWNPSTRQHHRLPPESGVSVPFHMYWYAFGYDDSSDDYKVVIVSRIKGETAVDVFSLTSNQWKRFRVQKHSHTELIMSKKGVILNGAVHWMAGDRLTGCCQIVAFDLEREEFREMPLWPAYPYPASITGLTVEGGCLCLRNYYDPTHLRIMKEYGVETSWTRMDSPYAGAGGSFPDQNMDMIWRSCEVWQSLNDEQYLLLVNNKIVCLYDRSHNRCKKILNMFYGMSCTYPECDFIALYMETLVSPYPPPAPTRPDQTRVI